MTDLSSSEIISENNQNITSSETESIVQDQSLNTPMSEQSFSEEVTETINEIEEPSNSNGLENFAIEEETLGLFDSETNDDNLKII